MINGIINIYKEKGYTSHDVVAKLRGILKQKKVGHTGTLDPEAEGVLPVCLGSGTKLSDILTDKDKEYAAGILLGVTTDTYDLTGQVISRSKPEVTKDEAIKAIMSFEGEYAQVPPMYSAIRVNGKHSYELARKGQQVKLEPRKVKIFKIEPLSLELPHIKIRVSCSKGTYIRSLAHDIGQRLGCGAAMESLIRTRSGRFGIEDAVTLDKVEKAAIENRISDLVIPVDKMFDDLSSFRAKPEAAKLCDNGNALPGWAVEIWSDDNTRIYGFAGNVPEQSPAEVVQDCPLDGDQVRIYDHRGEFCGIYEYIESMDIFKPIKFFKVP